MKVIINWTACPQGRMLFLYLLMGVVMGVSPPPPFSFFSFSIYPEIQTTTHIQTTPPIFPVSLLYVPAFLNSGSALQSHTLQTLAGLCPSVPPTLDPPTTGLSQRTYDSRRVACLGMIFKLVMYVTQVLNTLHV